jgi:organic radical activating enzyme
MSNFILKDNENVLTLLINTVCNYYCPYCSLVKETNINSHKKYEDNFNINNLKLLNNYNLSSFNQINILGGEPGLLSKEELDLIFNYFKDKNKIYIFTNGLFLEKYLEYYKDFNYAYHVIDFDSFVDYSKYNINLFHNYVVHNYECLEDFEKLLKFYSYINFEINFDFNLDIKNISDEFFNKFKYLVNNYSNININKFKKEMFLNKKKFSIISSILIKKQLKMYSNN